MKTTPKTTDEKSPVTYVERRSPFRHMKTIGLAVMVAVLAGAGFYGYGAYENYQEGATMRSLVAEQARINAKIADEMKLRGDKKAEIETHEAAIMAIKAEYDASVVREDELKAKRNDVTNQIVAEANKKPADKRGLAPSASAFQNP